MRFWVVKAACSTAPEIFGFFICGIVIESMGGRGSEVSSFGCFCGCSRGFGQNYRACLF